MIIYSKSSRLVHQLKDLKKCASDPIYFINTYLKTDDGKQIKLYPYQEQLIDSIQKNQNLICVKPRQAGLGYAIEQYIIWLLVFKTNQNIGLMSKHRHSRINYILFSLAQLPEYMKPFLSSSSSNQFVLSNGNRVSHISYNTSHIKGQTFNFLHMADFAYEHQDVQEDIWNSVAPFLSRNYSSIIMESTPNGRHNLFADIWWAAKAGTHPMTPFEIKANELPYYNNAWMSQVRAIMGEDLYRQEYDCEFLE